MNTIASVRQLISDVINGNPAFSAGEKMTFINYMVDRCTSVEIAREFIGNHNLAVVIPEDIASALLAEVETGTDRASYMADEGKDGHRSNFTQLIGDRKTDKEILGSNSMMDPQPSITETFSHGQHVCADGFLVNASTADAEADKGAFSHSQQVCADGFLANASTADAEIVSAIAEQDNGMSARVRRSQKLSPPLFCRSSYIDDCADDRNWFPEKKTALDIQAHIDRKVAEAPPDPGKSKVASVAALTECLNGCGSSHPPWECWDPCKNMLCVTDKRHVGRDCPTCTRDYDDSSGDGN